MKMVTETVQVTRRVREFEDNDVVLDRAWFAVGIRRYSASEAKALWFVTPPTPLKEDRVIRVYSDEEMSRFLDDGKFTYVGGYFDVRDNAPKVD